MVIGYGNHLWFVLFVLSSSFLQSHGQTDESVTLTKDWKIEGRGETNGNATRDGVGGQNTTTQPRDDGMAKVESWREKMREITRTEREKWKQSRRSGHTKHNEFGDEVGKPSEIGEPVDKINTVEPRKKVESSRTKTLKAKTKKEGEICAKLGAETDEWKRNNSKALKRILHSKDIRRSIEMLKNSAMNEMIAALKIDHPIQDVSRKPTGDRFLKKPFSEFSGGTRRFLGTDSMESAKKFGGDRSVLMSEGNLRSEYAEKSMEKSVGKGESSSRRKQKKRRKHGRKSITEKTESFARASNETQFIGNETKTSNKLSENSEETKSFPVGRWGMSIKTPPAQFLKNLGAASVHREKKLETNVQFEKTESFAKTSNKTQSIGNETKTSDKLSESTEETKSFPVGRWGMSIKTPPEQFLKNLAAASVHRKKKLETNVQSENTTARNNHSAEFSESSPTKEDLSRELFKHHSASSINRAITKKILGSTSGMKTNEKSWRHDAEENTEESGNSQNPRGSLGDSDRTAINIRPYKLGSGIGSSRRSMQERTDGNQRNEGVSSPPMDFLEKIIAKKLRHRGKGGSKESTKIFKEDSKEETGSRFHIGESSATDAEEKSEKNTDGIKHRIKVLTEEEKRENDTSYEMLRKSLVLLKRIFRSLESGARTIDVPIICRVQKVPVGLLHE